MTPFDSDGMDALLREAMGSDTRPSLPPTFDQRLARRLHPRRLSPKGRRLLVLYALAASGLSVLVMRSQALEWSLIISTVVVPILIVAAVQRRHALR